MTYDEIIDKKVEEAKQIFIDQILDILGRSDSNQSKISHITGMTRQNVTISLHRRNNSTLRTLCRIADALGYKVKITLEKYKKEM